jgi:hypothetical protein
MKTAIRVLSTVLLANLGLASSPSPASAVSMFEVDVRSQIRLIGHSGAPGDLLVGSWSGDYSEYDGWGYCNYSVGTHGGSAFSFKGDADCDVGSQSSVKMFAFQRDLDNYFMNVSDKPITVDLAYDYLVEARAIVRGGTSGDYARSIASAEYRSYYGCGQAGHTFEVSADTRTGTPGGRLFGSLPIRFVLETGALECVIDVDYDVYGEAFATVTRTAPIPLPAPAAFLGTALFGLGLAGRRRSRPNPAIRQTREAQRAASASRPAL